MSRYCTLTLLSTTFSFNTTVLPHQNQVQVGPTCSVLLAVPKFDQTICDFPYPISGLIQNSIPNFKPGLALHFQNMTSAATQENAFGLCDTQSVLLKGVF